MAMSKWVLAVLAAASVGIAVGWNSRSSPRSAATPAAVNGDGSSRLLGQEVDELKREVSQLKSARVEPQAAPPAPTAVTPRSDPPPAPPPTREERAARAKQVAERWRTELDAAFHSQTRDARWAPDTERKIESVLAGVDSVARVESAECGQTMCRVVVRHDDESQRTELAHLISEEEPFADGTAYSYDGLETTMFVTRKGQSLPRVEN
jgi:hypothetical protein